MITHALDVDARFRIEIQVALQHLWGAYLWVGGLAELYENFLQQSSLGNLHQQTKSGEDWKPRGQGAV